MKSGFRSIREIAAWSLPRLQPADSREDVTLTPIQRGPVWKPHQIESIWDSILRGFPVGSLVVTEGNEESGKHLQNYSHAPSSDKESEDQHDSKPASCKLQLVDGQQRANAISWAYVDPWSDANEEREGALWIDLCPAEGKEDERKYVLRMLTRSHPWGYQRNNPNARLHRGSYQEALECFALASQRQKDATWKPGKLDIRVAFPWDSAAPVPFSWVVQYVEDIPESSSTVAEVGTKLRKRLQETFPGWEKTEKT